MARIVTQSLIENEAGPPLSLHATLRAATRAAHLRLDTAMAGFDLADALSYRTFLCIHRDALGVLSKRCSPADRAEFEPLLSLVAADLARTRLPARVREAPDVATDRCVEVGVAYVVRGSRLGAAYLQRRVGTGFAAAYLRHELPTSWPAFLTHLEETARSTGPAATLAIVAAAEAAFGVFEAAAAGVIARAEPAG